MIDDASTDEAKGAIQALNRECSSCGNLESLKSCPACNKTRSNERVNIAVPEEKPLTPIFTKSASDETLSPAEICDYLERFRIPVDQKNKEI